MRGVKQTRFYRGDGRGNCVAAALASIFELELGGVDLPDGCSGSEVLSWSNNHYPSLRSHSVDHCINYRMVGSGGESYWTYDLPEEPPTPPTTGFWMATVVSHRGLLMTGPYRGSPILHAVVMEGDNLVWDPHPDCDWSMGPPTVVMSTWWEEVKDPDKDSSLQG